MHTGTIRVQKTARAIKVNITGQDSQEIAGRVLEHRLWNFVPLYVTVQESLPGMFAS